MTNRSLQDSYTFFQLLALCPTGFLPGNTALSTALKKVWSARLFRS
jgi:hypothetical protein